MAIVIDRANGNVTVLDRSISSSDPVTQLWAQLLYEEIFEIKSQVKSVIDMKEEILCEIRVETNKFKEELIAQVDECKQASNFLSTQFDDVKAKQVNTDTTLAAVNQENVNLRKEVNGLKVNCNVFTS